MATNGNKIMAPDRSNSIDSQSANSTHAFDLKVVRDAFINCIQPDDILLLGEYIKAYDELCVFIRSLGTVFEWATKDLTEKLHILKELRRLDTVHYETVQSMVSYEVESGRIKSRDLSITSQSGKPLQNGCRTLLRLHRSLAFLYSFMRDIQHAPEDANSSAIACRAYGSTLGRYHPWPIRYGITTAMKLTLPTRQQLVDKLSVVRTIEELSTFVDEMVDACHSIERITNKLYQQHGLTELP